MNNFEQIIKTKLRLPFTRSEVVPRLRLQKQIAEGLQNPLTLVIAPAGYGKTTLLAASLPDCRMPVAWLSLDRDDNQPGRFLSYLITAIQTAENQIGIEAAQLASQAHQVLPEIVLTSLINDLDGMNRELVLALDDYQFISNPDVHAVMAFLLEHLPLNFHLLIASRSDPPLPLSRLRARGQMVELRAADLRFTAEEAANFMNDVMNIHLDAKSISVLEERTEGWITGLQMAALSMRNRVDLDGFIAGFSGTNRHILDYLMEEILSSQTPEIQHFLLFTSICERLTATLCDAILTEEKVSGSSDIKGDITPGKLSFTQSASVLEILERENIFLIALDDERTWFRYHHLFADLLRARLHQSHPDVIQLLHMRASAWLEQNGLIIEAIQHLLTAGEISLAADLIEKYGPARLEDMVIPRFSEWRIISRPKCCLTARRLVSTRPGF